MVHVTKLVALLADLAVRRENAVPGALRAEVAAVVEQRREDLGGRQVDEAWLVEHLEHLSALAGGEGTRRRGPPRTRHRGRDGPIVRRWRHREHHAGRYDADHRGEVSRRS